MDIPGINYELLSLEIIKDIRIQFNAFEKSLLDINDLDTIINNFGYRPECIERQNLVAETNNRFDFIYVLTVVGRIFKALKTPYFKSVLLDAFHQMDREKHGVINLPDFIHYIHYNDDKSMTRSDIIYAFDAIDQNHDGQISIDEFKMFIYTAS